MHSDVLQSLGYIIVASAVVVLATRLLRVPTLVAYIATGLVLGPVTGLLGYNEAVDLISHVGIALLLFLVGLELEIGKIRDVGRVAVVAALAQMALTAAGGMGIALLLGFSLVESVFLGAAVMFSSTVVAVKLLSSRGDLHSLYGRISVGVLLVQDLVVIVILTFLAGLGAPDALEPGTLAIGLAKAFGGMVILLGAALAAARWILPGVFGWVAADAEAGFVWGLSWCFLLVTAAEIMGLSPEIGAFLAGISLAQLPHTGEMRRRVHPLTNFFIAVFFVSLGVQMELGAAAEHAWSALALSVFVLLAKPPIFLFVISRLGYGERAAFLPGITLAQISEFSFILAAAGLASGLIDEGLLSLIALVGLATIAASAYMIYFNEALLGAARRSGVLRLFRVPPEGEEGSAAAEIEGHVVVVGMNTLGRSIVQGLAEKGVETVAVDRDPAKLARLPGRTVVGSAESEELLEEAGASRARLIVSALQIEDVNTLLAFHARRLGVPASIHAFDASVLEELRELGVKHLMISKHDGVRRIAGELRRRGVL